MPFPVSSALAAYEFLSRMLSLRWLPRFHAVLLAEGGSSCFGLQFAPTLWSNLCGLVVVPWSALKKGVSKALWLAHPPLADLDQGSKFFRLLGLNQCFVFAMTFAAKLEDIEATLEHLLMDVFVSIYGFWNQSNGAIIWKAANKSSYYLTNYMSGKRSVRKNRAAFLCTFCRDTYGVCREGKMWFALILCKVHWLCFNKAYTTRKLGTDIFF